MYMDTIRGHYKLYMQCSPETDRKGEGGEESTKELMHSNDY